MECVLKGLDRFLNLQNKDQIFAIESVIKRTGNSIGKVFQCKQVFNFIRILNSAGSLSGVLTPFQIILKPSSAYQKNALSKIHQILMNMTEIIDMAKLQ